MREVDLWGFRGFTPDAPLRSMGRDRGTVCDSYTSHVKNFFFLSPEPSLRKDDDFEFCRDEESLVNYQVG